MYSYEKEDGGTHKFFVLKTQLLPVSKNNILRTEENTKDNKDKNRQYLLANILLLIWVLTVLCSIKSVWHMKIENEQLNKENAVLKKAVRDNIAKETFTNLPLEDASLGSSGQPHRNSPNLSWSGIAQIFWSSTVKTPGDKNLMIRDLAEQIYTMENKLDQLRIDETQVERTDDLEEFAERESQEMFTLVDNSEALLESKKQDSDDLRENDNETLKDLTDTESEEDLTMDSQTESKF